MTTWSRARILLIVNDGNRFEEAYFEICAHLARIYLHNKRPTKSVHCAISVPVDLCSFVQQHNVVGHQMKDQIGCLSF